MTKHLVLTNIREQFHIYVNNQPIWGREYIWFDPLTDPERIRGMNLSEVVILPYTKFKDDAYLFNNILKPMLMNLDGKFTYESP